MVIIEKSNTFAISRNNRQNDKLKTAKVSQY